MIRLVVGIIPAQSIAATRNARRFLCQCNSPDAGSGGEIEHAQFIFCFRHFQVIRELLCAAVAHGDDVLDELTEELRAFGLFIHGRYWPASARHLTYLQPFGGMPWQDSLEKSGERARLVADEERLAFWRERVFLLSIFLQQFEAHERIHDRAQTAHRRAGLLADLLDGFRAVLQRVENFVRDRCADDERRRVSKTKLLQTFGSDLFSRATFLRHIYFGFLEL